MNEIYKKLALKYNLTDDQVKDIITSKFLFFKSKIKEFENMSEFKIFHVDNFGKFYPTFKRMKREKKV